MSETDAMDEDRDICGETYDHRLRLVDERDGCRNYECLECGAEIFEDDDETGPAAEQVTGPND